MARKYPTTPMCSGEILERFEPTVRDTDVFTATIAKCGQTWLTALLYHLKTRGHDPDFGGGSLITRVPWLELPYDLVVPGRQPWDVEERLAMLEEMDAPRIFKMHVVWDEVPRPPGSRAKVITVTRDPRDVPYSMYRHLLALVNQPLGDPPPPFEEYFERWLELGYYFKFVENTWPHRDDPDLLWLRYEEMQKDTEREARKILDFLGWELADEDIARALPLASFKHMRAREERPDTVEAKMFSRGRFFREGGVGKNRQQLTPEMETRIVHEVRSRFSPECADFLLAQG